MVLRPFAGFDDGPRNFETEYVGSSGRRRIKPPALEDVGPVHARRSHLDEHFARTGTRHLPLDDGKLLRPVRLRADDCFHRRWDGVAHGAALIDRASAWVKRFRMDLEDLFPSKPGDPLVELAKQDLDPMSIEELQGRVESLKAEIARVEAHMARAQAHRSAAEDLFKK
jgi:uncharacterized small protein (DUF1192 family)